MIAAFSDNLTRVEKTLAEHGCFLAELQSLLCESASTPRTCRGDASGTDSGRTSATLETTIWDDSFQIGSCSPSPRSEASPWPRQLLTESPQPLDGRGSTSPLRPVSGPASPEPTTRSTMSGSANEPRIASLRRTLSEIQQCADQANWRLGKLIKKIDRHDTEIGDLRSKIIWAQADSGHQHDFFRQQNQQVQHQPQHHHQQQYHNSISMHYPHQSSLRHRQTHGAGSGTAADCIPLQSPRPATMSYGSAMPTVSMVVPPAQQPKQLFPQSPVTDHAALIGPSRKVPLHVTRSAAGGDVGATQDVAVVGPSSSYQPPQPTWHSPPTASFRPHSIVSGDRTRGGQHQHQHVLQQQQQHQQQQQQQQQQQHHHHHNHHQLQQQYQHHHHQHHQQHHHQQQYQQQQQQQQPQVVMMMTHGYGGTLHHQQQQYGLQLQQPSVVACSSSPTYADTVCNRPAITMTSSPGGGGEGSSRSGGDVGSFRSTQKHGRPPDEISGFTAATELGSWQQLKDGTVSIHGECSDATASSDRGGAVGGSGGGGGGRPRPLRSYREQKSSPDLVCSTSGLSTERVRYGKRE